MGPLTVAAALGGKYLLDTFAGWLGGGPETPPAADFRSRMLHLAEAVDAPTVELTDRTWKTVIDDYPIYVHAGGAVYSHSRLAFRRHRPALDAIRDVVNRDRSTPCECRVMEVDGVYVLWYVRKVPIDGLTPDTFARHCSELGGVARGVDIAVRRMS